MIDEVIADLGNKMSATIETLKRELARRRTGRANVALLDGIKVEYYGTLSPLNQVAALQVPDPRLITVKPWDKSLVPLIEKALQQSSLGLNPASDGELVRVPIPPLTGERRKDLVKDVRKVAEEMRVVLRGHRRDANEMARELEKDGTISEDALHRGLAKIQELTDDHVKQIDELVVAKEKQILED